MKIPLPKGYEPPADATPGKPFEAVATLVQEEDGTYELTAISGMPVGEEEEDDEEEMAPRQQMTLPPDDPLAGVPRQ